MGTPAFAVPVLSALVEAGQEVVAVYTRPDRPAGRGRRQIAPPVKRFAEERGLRVLQPATLKPSSVRQELASLSPDIAVVAAYGRLIPSETLSLPRLGFLNVHPSMLPRYRGPSPVSAAILNGDDVTGVTIIKLDEGMDSGPIVAVSRDTYRARRDRRGPDGEAVRAGRGVAGRRPAPMGAGRDRGAAAGTLEGDGHAVAQQGGRGDRLASRCRPNCEAGEGLSALARLVHALAWQAAEDHRRARCRVYGERGSVAGPSGRAPRRQAGRCSGRGGAGARQPPARRAPGRKRERVRAGAPRLRGVEPRRVSSHGGTSHVLGAANREQRVDSMADIGHNRPGQQRT